MSSRSRSFRLDGSAQGEQAGDTVAGPGDVDRDGHADVLIGTRACCAYLALPRFPAIVRFRGPLVGTPAAPSATLRLSINPRGFSTTAYVEGGPTASYGQRTSSRNVGNGTVPVTYTETVSGRLAAGRTYHYPVVATNTFGSTVSRDRLFRIPGR